MQKTCLYICLCSLILLLGCSSSGRTFSSQSRSSGKYTSAFPSRDVSSYLREIQRSVKRYTSTASYQVYSFGKQNITHKSVQKYGLEKLSHHRSKVNHSKAGTAVCILKNDDFSAFVTAGHIVAFPDTLRHYKQVPGVPKHAFLKSIGIKTGQKSYIYNGDKIKKLNLRAHNQDVDLALMSIRHKNDNFKAYPAPLSMGDSKQLQIGTFLYVIGYPLGTPMVTRAIVSAPDYDNRGEFLTDGLFNHGISGGLIMASHDDFRSFEWVGMALRSSATDESYLAPNPTKTKLYSNLDAYPDTAFVRKTKRINYGVTQAVSINQILFFLYRNEDILNNLGLSSTDLAQDK